LPSLQSFDLPQQQTHPEIKKINLPCFFRGGDGTRKRRRKRKKEEEGKN